MIKNYLKLFVVLIITTNIMAQNIPSYLPKDGLVGWWPFNGNANDESGNGNNGTVNGATLTTDRNGMVNSAYDFNGDNDFIELTSGANSNLNILGNVSVNFWLTTEQLSAFAAITFGDNVGIDGGFLVDHIISDQNNNNPNKVSFWTKERWVAFGTIWNDNNSNLISITLESGVLKIYKNGKLEQIFFDQPGVSSYSGNRYFGKGSNSLGYLKGQLDDIAIYNRALSDQEVKQLYEGCTKETATSSSFNSVVYTTNTHVNLSANPTGGTFNGEAVANNSFNPSKAKLGKNQVKYNFKNSTGCADSTNFTMILVDTLGNKCTETIYDTIKVKESTYDTLKIKVQLTTGIKAGQLTSMNVYPNPASELLIIEANDIQALGGYKYKIVDLQGKEVYNALAITTKTEISIKSIGAKGMYILHIVDEKGISIENKKIVLE